MRERKKCEGEKEKEGGMISLFEASERGSKAEKAEEERERESLLLESWLYKNAFELIISQH